MEKGARHATVRGVANESDMTAMICFVPMQWVQNRPGALVLSMSLG